MTGSPICFHAWQDGLANRLLSLSFKFPDYLRYLPTGLSIKTGIVSDFFKG